jgi:hypothetical protein
VCAIHQQATEAYKGADFEFKKEIPVYRFCGSSLSTIWIVDDAQNFNSFAALLSFRVNPHSISHLEEP